MNTNAAAAASRIPTSNASVTSATSQTTTKSSTYNANQITAKLQSTSSKPNSSSYNKTNNRPGSSRIGRSTSKEDDLAAIPSDEDSIYDENKEKEHVINRAKTDLLQLGIELDDDIIERLQNNLKIEKIFQIAHQASKVMMKKPANLTLPNGIVAPNSPKGPTHSHSHHNVTTVIGANGTITYRNVSTTNPSTPNKGAAPAPVNPITAIAGDHPIVSILNPKDTIQSDEKHAVELLLKLENRQNDMEPQHRPMIEQVIEKFRLQYARYPEKFICRLLGQKLPSTNTTMTEIVTPTKNGPPSTTTTTANTAAPTTGGANVATTATTTAIAGGEGDNNGFKGKAATRAAINAAINDKIMHWILQKRYITQIDFQMMLSRVLPTHLENPQEVSAILFKLLAETKRFQSNKKKEVVDLWSFLTFLKVASDESRRSYDARTSRLATDIEFWKRNNGEHVVLAPTSSGGGVNNKQGDGKIVKRYTDYSQDPVKIIVDPSQAPASIETSYPAKKNPDGRIPRSFSASRIRTDNKKPLAELLGQAHHEHCSQAQQGRKIMGTFHQETVNSCDIPAALHSPPRTRPKSPSLNHRALQDEHRLPIPPAEHLLDSRKVAYLLNQKTLMQAQSLHNGQLQASSSSAGGRRTSSVNTLQKEQLNNTSVAGALGREAVVPPPPPSSNGKLPSDAHLQTNWSLTGHNTSSRPRSQSQSRRMNLSSANNLYWETDHPPSVAAALGGNTSYLRQNSVQRQ